MLWNYNFIAHNRSKKKLDNDFLSLFPWKILCVNQNINIFQVETWWNFTQNNHNYVHDFLGFNLISQPLFVIIVLKNEIEIVNIWHQFTCPKVNWTPFKSHNINPSWSTLTWDTLSIYLSSKVEDMNAILLLPMDVL